MVKLQLIKTLIGTPMQKSGSLIEVSETQAKRFVEAGIAVPVREEREKAIPKDVTEKRAVQRNKQSRRRTNKSKRS
jgi:hypothetical protein